MERFLFVTSAVYTLFSLGLSIYLYAFNELEEKKCIKLTIEIEPVEPTCTCTHMNIECRFSLTRTKIKSKRYFIILDLCIMSRKEYSKPFYLIEILFINISIYWNINNKIEIFEKRNENWLNQHFACI